ncbi:MAG: glycosyltransferase family 9 protein [Gammaproteobacteria bacterium]|nr:glycosyltransferase family 9 protein [Gammaproteobacteria bacterium]
MATHVPNKILIVRNDKLGDFILSFPAMGLLKASLPSARIYALVPEYTRDMAEACSWIDEVLIDKWQNKSPRANLQLLQLFKQHQFDAIITLYSTTRIGFCAFAARIPYRLAPATKLAQLFYNHRLTQHRSRSEKPEHAYNSDLVQRFCQDHQIEIAAPPHTPLLQFEPATVHTLRIEFCRQHQIAAEQQLVFIHPGSGGSARNLSTEQYAQLARQLRSEHGHTVVISAGPGEYENAHRLGKLLTEIPHVVYESRQGLKQFAEHIQFADLFIGGSTGPIHVAGALDRPTVAFYPRRRSATSLRWQTLNSDGKRLAFSPPADAEQEDMSKIDINEVARTINQHYLG